jgi:hypothetical protein
MDASSLQPQPQNRARFSRDFIVLAAYLVLALVLTYPLIARFFTHVAGDGSDDPALAWNLWWVRYALLDLGRSPIYTNYMFYPIGLNLAFYTLTYLNAFLSIPLQFTLGLVPAANVNLILSFVLSGYGVYLLVAYLLRRGRGANWQFVAPFVAGALYAFSANKFLYASLGQFNIASSHWIPFYILILLKVTDPANSKFKIQNSFLLGLFLLFQALSEFIFASFLIIFTVIYLTYWLIANRSTIRNLQSPISNLLLAVFVFLLPMSPILAAMVEDMLTEGDFIQRGLGFANIFSADLLGYFVPSHLHPVFGGLESQFHFAYFNFVYLGYAALALALIAVVKVPRARIWGLFFVIFLLITLGPNLRINGQEFAAPFLPFNLLLEIPFVKGNRYPSRWSVMLTLALAVMVGYGLVWASEKLGAKSEKSTTPVNFYMGLSKACPERSRRVKSQKWSLLFTFSFLLFTLFEHLAVPLPTSDFQIPDVYQTIARDPGEFTVLEVPLAWRNGFRLTGTIDKVMMIEQWYQTAYQRPMLGGNTSRNPELKFQYFTEVPVLNSLIAVETKHQVNQPSQLESALVPEVLHFFGVRYVVWHSSVDPANREATLQARTYIEKWWTLVKFYDTTEGDRQTVAYRVNDNLARDAVEMNANDPLARLNFAEGWGTLPLWSFESPPKVEGVWAQRREVKVFAHRLDRVPSNAVLSLRAFAPKADQRVTVRVNDRVLMTFALAQGWGEYLADLPENALHVGLNEIALGFDRLVPAASVRRGDYAIGKTGVVSPVNLVVRSAGEEIGDFGHIYVNGVDESPNGRGYNVVVIDPRSGLVEDRAWFDTCACEASIRDPEKNSRALAAFIAQIPNGKIVAIAARDEASFHLTEDAVDALKSVGAAKDLRGGFRWAHAIVGVKGAAEGSALEQFSLTWPAQIVVGVGVTEPNVAAAVEWIRIEGK